MKKTCFVVEKVPANPTGEGFIFDYPHSCGTANLLSAHHLKPGAFSLARQFTLDFLILKRYTVFSN